MAKNNTQVKSKGKKQKYVNTADKAAENAKLEAKIAEKSSDVEKKRQEASKELFQKREATQEEKELLKRQEKEKAESHQILRKFTENKGSKDTAFLAERSGISLEEISKVTWKIDSYHRATDEEPAIVRMHGEIDIPTDIIHLDKLHPYTLMEVSADRELRMQKGKVEREGNITYLRSRASKLSAVIDGNGELNILEVNEPFRRVSPHDLSVVKAGPITAESAKNAGYNFVTLV